MQPPCHTQRHTPAPTPQVPLFGEPHTKDRLCVNCGTTTPAGERQQPRSAPVQQGQQQQPGPSDDGEAALSDPSVFGPFARQLPPSAAAGLGSSSSPAAPAPAAPASTQVIAASTPVAPASAEAGRGAHDTQRPWRQAQSDDQV